MKLSVKNFTRKGKICKKYICKNHGGSNVIPSVLWGKVDGTKSYALILEDPNAVHGTFIHWFIPFISPEILEINELNFDFLKRNQLIQDKIEFYGPCAPNKIDHNYTFIIYGLNKKIRDINMKIYDHNEFEEKLKEEKINILSKSYKIFQYQYMNFITPTEKINET
jgi:Raf kinase inhibitor-like YbhB/YbcL family protein